MSTPAIQNAILVRLAEDGRRFRWPVLTPRAWDKIENDPTYADRTEFIGDSLIHTTIALRLHERFPYATAGAYTVMIQALVSNATFYHLSAVAPTTYYVSRTCPWTGKDTRHKLATKVPYATSKRGGDKFETVLAEYHALYGFGALLDWTRRNFDNLIDVAWDALQESKQESKRPQLDLKRKLPKAGLRDKKRARLQYADLPLRSPSPRRCIVNLPSRPMSKQNASPLATYHFDTTHDTPPTERRLALTEPGNATSAVVMGDGSLQGFKFTGVKLNDSSIASTLTAAPAKPSSIATGRSLSPGSSARVPALAVPKAPEIIDLTMDNDDDDVEDLVLSRSKASVTGSTGSTEFSTTSISSLARSRHDLALANREDCVYNQVLLAAGSGFLLGTSNGSSTCSSNNTSPDDNNPFESSLPFGESAQATPKEEDSDEEADAVEVEGLLEWLDGLGLPRDQMITPDGKLTPAGSRAASTRRFVHMLPSTHEPVRFSLVNAWRRSMNTPVFLASGDSSPLAHALAKKKPPQAAEQLSNVPSKTLACPLHSAFASTSSIPSTSGSGSSSLFSLSSDSTHSKASTSSSRSRRRRTRKVGRGVDVKSDPPSRGSKKG